MPETLLPTATASTGQQTSPSAQAQTATAPAQQGNTQGELQANGTAPSTDAAAMTPQAKLEARQKIARDIAERRSSGTANDRAQAAGGTQGSQAKPAQAGDLKPQAGVSATNDSKIPGGPDADPAQAGATFTFGKITGLNAQQFEAAIKHEQRLVRELGQLGSKLAKGEALTPAEVQQLAEHTAKRAATLSDQQARSGTAKATTQAAGTAESQTPSKTNGQGNKPGGKPPSPGTDGLDAAFDQLAFYNDAATATVRTAFDGMRAKLQDAETKLAELTEKEKTFNEQTTDRNLAACTTALLSSYPELQQPGVLEAICEKMEAFDPNYELSLAGGQKLLDLFTNAAQLVILPQRLNGHRADLLTRTASERQGAPAKPPAANAAATVVRYTRQQARTEVAKAISEMQPGPEREARIKAIKESTVE